MHGGATPAVRAAAQRRRAEAEATALLNVIWDPDAPPVTDPVAALQSLAGRLQHAVNVLGGLLDVGQLDGPTGLAWARALKEFRQSLEGMERLDAEGKQVRLEQERAQLVTQAFTQAIDELSLLPAERDHVIRCFLALLRDEPKPERGAGDVVRGELG